MSSRPRVIASFTAPLRGASTNFRLVSSTPDTGGAYVIEVASTDSVGAPAWVQLTAFALTSPERTSIGLTASPLAAMIDKLAGVQSGVVRDV